MQLLQHPGQILVQRATSCDGHTVHLLREPGVKRLGHLLRLANAAALDDDVVERLELREAHELLEQVPPQRAAYAAVLERHDLFFGLAEVVRFLNERGVDVDPGLIVSPPGPLSTTSLALHMVQFVDGVGDDQLTLQCHSQSRRF